MKERMIYAARIWRDEYGYEVEFPQLDLATNGKDFDEALFMAADALETYLTDYRHDKKQPPKSDLDIEVHPGDHLAVISVYVDPLLDYELTTSDVMSLLGVNKQRVQQLRSCGKIRAYKKGRDYLHSRSDAEALKSLKRRAGRPRTSLAPS